MSAIKKTKMVSFRISREEYRLLQGACSKAGARSVSELARSAMQRIILDAGLIDRGSTDAELRELQLKFSVLSAEVDRLSRLLRDRS
ncbi:MAG TPA: hypothetical protein VHZ07_24865 [Bryobacteraceae bacterium]|nr:hypothetical protein [Bryobacteraceae bacterium]